MEDASRVSSNVRISLVTDEQRENRTRELRVSRKDPLKNIIAKVFLVSSFACFFVENCKDGIWEGCLKSLVESRV